MLAVMPEMWQRFDAPPNMSGQLPKQLVRCLLSELQARCLLVCSTWSDIFSVVSQARCLLEYFTHQMPSQLRHRPDAFMMCQTPQAYSVVFNDRIVSKAATHYQCWQLAPAGIRSFCRCRPQPSATFCTCRFFSDAGFCLQLHSI